MPVTSIGPVTLDALWAIGYDKELAFECRLSGEVDEVLPVAVRRMRQAAWSDRRAGDSGAERA